jgi:hypothetical protein
VVGCEGGVRELDDVLSPVGKCLLQDVFRGWRPGTASCGVTGALTDQVASKLLRQSGFGSEKRIMATAFGAVAAWTSIVGLPRAKRGYTATTASTMFSMAAGIASSATGAARVATCSAQPAVASSWASLRPP